MSYEPKPGLVSKFVDFIANRSKTSFILVILLVAALAPGWNYFGERYDVRIWFRTTDPLIKVLDTFEKQFGNDESLVIVVHSPSGIFDTESATLVRELTERMWKLPEIIRVDSLSNYNYSYAEEDDIIVESFFPELPEPLTDELLSKKKAIALKHKVLPGYLISRDAKTVMLFARLATVVGGSPSYENIVRDARVMMKDFEGKGDHEFHILGEAAVNDAFRETAANDGAIILPCLFLLMIAYLYFIFRSFVAMAFPIAITVLSVVMSMGTGFYFGILVNNILSILPAILISISIADSVHVIVTYFQFKAHGITGREAAYKALHKNFIPTLLTSVSTMIGFFSLTFTELVPIKHLGVLAGIGCLYAWILSIFLMGPLLFWFDFKVPKLFLNAKSEDGKGTSFSKRCTTIVARFKIPIIVFSILIAGVSLFLGTKVKINSNPYDYFTKDQPIRKANDFVKKTFGGNAGPEFVISSGKVDGIKDPEFLKKVESFKDWIDAHDYVNKSIDIIDIIKDMNKNLNFGEEKYYVIPHSQKSVAEELFLYSMSLPQGMDLNNRMTLNYDTMRMTVLWSIYDTNGWLTHVDEFEAKARDIGLDVKTTGKFFLFQRMMKYVVTTFFKSIALALVLIAILMMIVFRSVKLGLISLIPNIIPIAFGGALLYVLDIPLNIGSSLVASVTLGIAVDDTIHFLSNYYRLTKEGESPEDAIAYIFTYTGSALMVTTIILASGFGLYLFGNFVPNIHFGILCATILTGALIVDLVFLPALLLQLAAWSKKK